MKARTLLLALENQIVTKKRPSVKPVVRRSPPQEGNARTLAGPILSTRRIIRVTYFCDLAPMSDEEIQNEISNQRQLDVGADVLPFAHLEARRFEILVYRLKKADASYAEKKVDLLKSVGDRGRDILVYSAQGHLEEIVQCKNFTRKLDKGELLHELVKIALHSAKDKDLLGTENITYEIWCTGGFTEPASDLLDKWPNSWIEDTILPAFDDVTKKYEGLKELNWESIKTFILNEFPTKISTKKLGRIDITEKVREQDRIFEEYFVAKRVLDEKTTLKNLLDTLAQGSVHVISDSDMQHIHDRVSSFPADRRFYIGSGYVLGIPLELIRLMNKEENFKFGLSIMSPVHNIRTLMTDVILREIQTLVEKAQQEIRPRNRAFFYMLKQYFVLEVLRKTEKSSLLGSLPAERFSRFKEFSALQGLDFAKSLCKSVWKEMEHVSKGKTVKDHPRAKIVSDLFQKISAHVIKGYPKDGVKFTEELIMDFENNWKEISEIQNEISKLVPDNLLIISDSQSAFEDKDLMRRMMENARQVESKGDGKP